jgi:acetolactate synthase-1/2/3 large subunit
MEKALYLALSGRPGPVLLDIPLDVQASLIDPDALPGYSPPSSKEETVAESDLQKLHETLQNAQRPLILAGHGVRAAGLVPLFRDLIEKWQIPVATTQMAKDLVPDEHPLFVGHPGPRAHRGANYAIQTADVIVTIGCSLHIQTVGYEGELFAPGAHKIQIDLDEAVLQREHVGTNWQLAWDLHDYLPRLGHLVTRQWDHPEAGGWRDACRNWKQQHSSRNEPHELGNADDPVNLYEFADVLSDLLSGEETILTDAGQPHPILGQALLIKGDQRYLNPGSFAGMGWALPASLGAAAAAPTNTIVAVIGDGSLQTNIQELQTLVHHRFNVKIFIINNDGYASIRNTQKSFFNGFFVGSTPASGVTLPDTRKICEAYGLTYLCCNTRRDLIKSIRQVLTTSGPVLCEIMGQHDQRILPAVPSQLLPDGSMRSKALHEMAPQIDVGFIPSSSHLQALPPT